MTDLDQQAREVLDSIRYVVLASFDPNGHPRASPVYFVPYGYRRLYWVSNPDSQHSHNLRRDPRVGAVVFDSTVPPGQGRAVYLTGTAHEIPSTELGQHLSVAFDPEGRGGRRFSAGELCGEADLRLWVLDIERCEAHVPAGHPELGTGTDRRVQVHPSH